MHLSVQICVHLKKNENIKYELAHLPAACDGDDVIIVKSTVNLELSHTCPQDVPHMLLGPGKDPYRLPPDEFQTIAEGNH